MRVQQTLDPLQEAFIQAQAAAQRHEVPIGAVIVSQGVLLAAAGNAMRAQNDPTAHAEILVIRHVCRLRHSIYLNDCDLYVTLEPCTMCAAAISLTRLRRLYFAAYDPKGGAVDHGVRWFEQPTCHHKPAIIGGLQAQKATTLLQSFFQQRRKVS